MKKGRIVLRIISIVFVVAALVFAGYMIRRVIVKPAQENNANRAPDVMLSTPKNVSYSDETYTLTWDAVEHADSYKLDINGNKIDVEGTSYAYLPSHEVTSFKVQALETTGGYKTSEWSDEIRYMVSKTEGLSAASVNVYVAEGMEIGVTKIVSIYSDGNFVHINSVDTKGFLHSFVYQYDYQVESLADVIKKGDQTMISVGGLYDAKDFDTAGNYLQSSELQGQLGEYKLNGYTISVVSAHAYEVNNTRIGLVGIYRATKDGETKYLAEKTLFFLDATATESVRYTRGVNNVDLTKVHEVSCVELQGDFIDALELYVDGFQKD